MEGSTHEAWPLDSRGLALVVFQKLHQELGRLEDDPADVDLRRWILEAVECLPAVTVETGARPHELVLRSLEHPDSGNSPTQAHREVVLNVQLTMDALRLLWREYREAMSMDD